MAISQVFGIPESNLLTIGLLVIDLKIQAVISQNNKRGKGPRQSPEISAQYGLTDRSAFADGTDKNSMTNLQTVSIIAAFPVGIIMLLIVGSFFKDAKLYLDELRPGQGFHHRDNHLIQVFGRLIHGNQVQCIGDLKIAFLRMPSCIWMRNKK